MTTSLFPPPETRPEPLPRCPDPKLVQAVPLPWAEPTPVPDWWTPAETAQTELFARRVMGVLLEAVCGRRPLGQLVRWTSPEVLGELTQRARLWQRDRRPLSLCSLHLQQPTSDAVEVAAHYRQGERSRALALRFEKLGSRWTVAVAEFGPD